MPQLAMHSPEDAPPALPANPATLDAWVDRTNSAQRDAWRDLIGVLSLGDLRTRAGCCDDPTCAVSREVGRMYLRVWGLIPFHVLEAEFGRSGALAILRGE